MRDSDGAGAPVGDSTESFISAPGLFSDVTGRRRQLVFGFAATGVLLVVLLLAVGPEKIAERLSRTDPVVFSLSFLAVLGALWCWSEALAALLGDLDGTVSGLGYRAAYMTAEFVKKLLPMGQAAAPLFLAYLVSRETDTPYEETLAATAIFSLLNIVTSLTLATLALAALLAAGTDLSGPVYGGLLVVLGVSITVVATLVVLVRVRRAFLERLAARLAGGVRETVGRVSVRVREALAPDRVRGAVADLSASVDAVFANWRGVALAAALSVVGWALFLVPIYTGVLALDEHVPYALVAFVVPLVMMVNVMPLPGGFGGFDVAVAALLAHLGDISLPTAAAALFLYRLSNYWFVVLLGAVSSAALSVTIDDPPPVLDADEEDLVNPDLDPHGS